MTYSVEYMQTSRWLSIKLNRTKLTNMINGKGCEDGWVFHPLLRKCQLRDLNENWYVGR